METEILEMMDTEEQEVVGEIVYCPTPDSKLSNGEKIYRGSLKNSITKVVVKIVEVQELKDFTKCISREIQAAKESDRIQNVLNIVKIESKVENGKHFKYIAYENFDFTLNNLVNGGVHHSESIKHILLTATEGLMHFLEKNFVHRNIRPENIVIRMENNELNGKVADFSMSKTLTDGKHVTISRDFSENGFSAPELINFFKQKKSSESTQRSKVNEKVDVFSMGVVYFYALTGYHLFERDGKTVQQHICNRNFQPTFKTLYGSKYLKPLEIPLAIQLIKAMVQYDPDKRPSIKQILNHPLFWTDSRKEMFLKAASQYIQGNKVEKDLMDLEFGSTFDGWLGKLDEEVKKNLQAKGGYKNNASDFLRSFRNMAAHQDDLKNQDLRIFFEKFPGRVVECYSQPFPKYFSSFYNYFHKKSSVISLREFYCDCYIGSRFAKHKCNKNENFCAYDWEKY